MATEQQMPFPGVPPKDHGPSQKDIDGQLAPNAVERLIQRLGRSRATYATLAVGTASVGVYAYVTNPNVQKTVNEVYHNLLQTLGRETVVPTIFDSKKDVQTIGDNNVLRITPEDANKQNLLAPQFNPETGTVTIFSPLVLPKDTNATIDKTPYTVRGIDHQTERNIVPANTEIIFPKGARVTLIRGTASQGEDPNLAYNVSFSWYDEKNNVTIAWGFYPINGGLKTNLPLHDQPIKGISEIDNEKLPISDGKTSVATTTITDTFYTAGAIYTGKIISPENYRGQIKELNYATQNGKLLVLEPS